MPATTVFTIKERGQTTGELFEGTFECKNYLTHRDDLYRDRIRRELLAGNDMDKSDPRAASIADAVSTLRVKLTKWEKWFERTDFGLDMADDNVLLKLLEEVNKAEMAHIKALHKDSEDAKKDLTDENQNSK